MAEDPNYYHCRLEADMSMYDHLPYHINPELCDGTHITLYSGNVLRGCPVNYLEKKLIVPNDDISDNIEPKVVPDNIIMDDTITETNEEES